MKTITEEIYNRYPNSESSDIYPVRLQYILNAEKGAFSEGIRFAQKFISINKELPEENSNGFSELVITKNSFDNYMLERYDFEGKCFNGIRYDAKEAGDGQVSHWRPIELK